MKRTFMRFMFAQLLFTVIFSAIALCQDTKTVDFDYQSFIIQLVSEGGAAMLVSGWVASKWTHASGVPMLIQTFVVSIVLTAAASVVGIIPVHVTEFWAFLRTSFTNGVLAALLYKLGIFNSLLTAVQARTQHQLVQSSGA